MGSVVNSPWQQGGIVDVAIARLSNTGDGVGHWQDRVVFVPDTVPGDRVRVRLLRVKSSHAQGQSLELLESSTQRVRPPCIVADKCGGCQWQTVAYDEQLAQKQANVLHTLARIGHLEPVPLDPIVAAPDPLGYRNKVSYPLAQQQQRVLAGYYRKGSHQLVNLNQCPVQDPRLNPLLAGIKSDLQQQGWPIYQETTHQGNLRHLGLRIGRRTGEILITLVGCDSDLPGLQEQAQVWLNHYPGVVGVCFNHHPDPGNRIFGDRTEIIVGQANVREILVGLEFQICATTFFQVNTEQAENLISCLVDQLQLTGSELIVDAYCGVGTLSLPLAQKSRRLIGVEHHGESVYQASLNAQRNQIQNAEFIDAAVEDWLPQQQQKPDIVVLDPPRKGCDRRVIDALLVTKPQRIVYVSCNPATLARDLSCLCQQGDYRLERVQPFDFFPQTAHVETLTFLCAN